MVELLFVPVIAFGPYHGKNMLYDFVNTLDADQPANQNSLISTLDVCCQGSNIPVDFITCV